MGPGLPWGQHPGALPNCFNPAVGLQALSTLPAAPRGVQVRDWQRKRLGAMCRSLPGQWEKWPSGWEMQATESHISQWSWPRHQGPQESQASQVCRSYKETLADAFAPYRWCHKDTRFIGSCNVQLHAILAFNFQYFVKKPMWQEWYGRPIKRRFEFSANRNVTQSRKCKSCVVLHFLPLKRFF